VAGGEEQEGRVIIQQYQPKGSSLCGQTCVAMACGSNCYTVAHAMGTLGGTCGTDIIRGLRKFGVATGDRMVRFGKTHRIYRVSEQHMCMLMPVRRCIAKVRSEGERRSHWVLFWDGRIFDPYPVRVPWQYVSGYVEIKEGDPMTPTVAGKGGA
jgi:hypothetical protein